MTKNDVIRQVRKETNDVHWKACKQNIKGSVFWLIGILSMVKGVSLWSKSDEIIGRCKERLLFVDALEKVAEEKDD